MPFHHLPPEILGQILRSIASTQDLHHLISASPICLDIFRHSRQAILSTTLRNAIHPEALASAVACIAAPDKGDSWPWLYRSDVLAPFLETYTESVEFCDRNFPGDMDGILQLARLSARVERLMQGYAEQTLRMLYADPDRQFERSHRNNGSERRPSGLSLTEEGRLQRAFFRYELYCRCFPPRNSGMEDTIASGDFQYINLISRISPWESEELCCLYQHFWVRLGTEVYDLEEQVILSAVRNESKKNRPRTSRQVTPTHKDIAYDTECLPSSSDEFRSSLPRPNPQSCGLDIQDLLVLRKFSENGELSPDNIRGLLNRGLRVIEGLLVSEGRGRVDIMRTCNHEHSDFLPDAVDRAASAYEMTILFPSDTEDEAIDVEGASPGYLQYRSTERWAAYAIRSFDEEIIMPHWNLRKLGYVFWDHDRVWEGISSHNLSQAMKRENTGFVEAVEDWSQFSHGKRSRVQVPKGLLREQRAKLWDTLTLDIEDQKGDERAVEDEEDEEDEDYEGNREYQENESDEEDEDEEDEEEYDDDEEDGED